MKIVVLGGGISTERHVSLVTGTSICKALRARGHKAVFVDMFLGLENWEGPLEACTCPFKKICTESPPVACFPPA